jgi:hypothetical protein
MTVQLVQPIIAKIATVAMWVGGVAMWLGGVTRRNEMGKGKEKEKGSAVGKRNGDANMMASA